MTVWTRPIAVALTSARDSEDQKVPNANEFYAPGPGVSYGPAS